MAFENFADPSDQIETSSNTPLQADRTLHGSRVKIKDGVVKSVRSLTYDTYELVIENQSGSDIAPKAGQYATILPQSLDHPRSYSFARAPQKENPGQHTFFVRLVPDGKFSKWLEKGEECVGEKVTLSGPLGHFCLDSSNTPAVCIAGGSGMSAIFALLEDAVERQVERDVLFLYGARTQKDLYCLDEIAAFQKNWNPKNKFEFVPVLSQEPDDSDWSGAKGFVTEYFKENYIDTGQFDPAHSKAFFCGPPPMIDSGVEILSSAGMNRLDIFYDKFEDATSPAPVIDNAKCVLCDECLLVKPVANCIVEVSKIHGDGNGKSYTPVSPQETSGLYYTTLYIDESECIRCYSCVYACPAEAIDPANSQATTTLANVIGT